MSLECVNRTLVGVPSSPVNLASLDTRWKKDVCTKRKRLRTEDCSLAVHSSQPTIALARNGISDEKVIELWNREFPSTKLTNLRQCHGTYRFRNDKPIDLRKFKRNRFSKPVNVKSTVSLRNGKANVMVYGSGTVLIYGVEGEKDAVDAYNKMARGTDADLDAVFSRLTQ